MKDILKERNASDQKYCKEIGKDFDGLISRLNMAEERIFEFEDISIETSKLKSKGKKPAKKNRMSKKYETSIKGITTYVMAIPEKKRKRGICSTNA